MLCFIQENNNNNNVFCQETFRCLRDIIQGKNRRKVVLFSVNITVVIWWNQSANTFSILFLKLYFPSPVIATKCMLISYGKYIVHLRTDQYLAIHVT